ncbi:MAG: 30S ribosomal protein S2 [Coxiella sp. RIFCSPHIGHO2_12_FULL_42_15]|nr:MAG: 30S ribosomal protein S2 [Coxiella sp. RIFCSPHIGHO2_12_FULL_42_15]
MTVDVTMRDMLEAGVHFGHQTRYWNPKMAPYIYGSRHNIHIINLEESLPMFRQALNFIHEVASRRGKVLFVGTKHAARDVVREEASRAGMPYIDYRWLGGMLTNYKTIRQSIKRLKELEERLANESLLASMTKKEVLNLMRAKEKLHTNLSGIKNMGGLPDVLFVIDVGMEKIAIQEAIRLGIPVVGIADTNADPKGVDYLIPGNDDAVRAIRFYCKTIADTIIAARGAADLVEAKHAGEDAEEIDGVEPKKKVVTKKKAKKSKKAADGSDADSDDLPEKKPAAKKPVSKKAVTIKVDKSIRDADAE